MFGIKRRKNILVLGHKGMLGHDVYEYFQKLSCDKKSDIGVVTGFDKDCGLDLLTRRALSEWMNKSIHYDWCINCIAYTDTKSEESTDEGKKTGYMLNAILPGFIAEACAWHKTKLVHISTDYVFSEYAEPSMPSGFCPWDAPFPKNEYGKHKLIGELAVKNTMGFNDYAVLRTSWIYSTNNCKSFIHKFLKNCIKKYAVVTSETPVPVGVTSNEYSIPTSCAFLVKCIDKVIHGNVRGVNHAVPGRGNGPVDGVSRYYFAKAVLEDVIKETASPRLLAVLKGILVEPVLNSGYYPARSTLCSTFQFMGNWRYYLDEFICQNIKSIEDYCTRILDEESVSMPTESEAEATA